MSRDMSISVVITTTNRVGFLKRAVESVINQKVKPNEIVIVIDGESADTVNYIEEISKSISFPVNYFETINNVGGSEARNIGASLSNSHLIALMDDDDEWKETKLEKQLAEIKKNKLSTTDAFLSFTSLLTYSDPYNKKYKKLPNKDYLKSGRKSISSYLFETEGLKNIGFIQTSTIIVPKWLILETGFTKGLPKHQDWDWLLKLDTNHDLKVIQVEDPQIIYHADVPKKQRVGYAVNQWKVTKGFYQRWQHVFSENAKESFLLNYLVLGLIENTEISLVKRIHYVIKIFSALPIKTLFKLYTFKVYLYILRGLFKS